MTTDYADYIANLSESSPLGGEFVEDFYSSGISGCCTASGISFCAR